MHISISITYNEHIENIMDISIHKLHENADSIPIFWHKTMVLCESGMQNIWFLQVFLCNLERIIVSPHVVAVYIIDMGKQMYNKE